MDLGIVALVVLATFSTVHERMIELIRRTLRGPPEYTDLDAIRDGFGRGLFREVGTRARDKESLSPAPPSPGLIRRFAAPYRWKSLRKLLDGATIGPWSALLAIGLAFLTHADALALFHRARPGDAASDIAFFETYLTGWSGMIPWRPWTWDAPARRAVLGCILMGMSTALGSRFWHDLSKGLVDLRANARERPKEAGAQAMRAPPSTDSPA